MPFEDGTEVEVYDGKYSGTGGVFGENETRAYPKDKVMEIEYDPI
jgi:hypothetical protein